MSSRTLLPDFADIEQHTKPKPGILFFPTHDMPSETLVKLHRIQCVFDFDRLVRVLIYHRFTVGFDPLKKRLTPDMFCIAPWLRIFNKLRPFLALDKKQQQIIKRLFQLRFVVRYTPRSFTSYYVVNLDHLI